MTTKADKSRNKMQPETKKQGPSQRRPRREASVDDTNVGESGTDRKASGNTHKASKRVARRGGPDLEPTAATAKPSRKSTRGSAGRVKQATNLQRRTVRATHAPKTRASRPAKRATRSKAAGSRAPS